MADHINPGEEGGLHGVDAAGDVVPGEDLDIALGCWLEPGKGGEEHGPGAPDGRRG